MFSKFRASCLLIGLAIARPITAFSEEGFFDIDKLPDAISDVSSTVGLVILEREDGRLLGLGTGIKVCSADKALILTALHNVKNSKCSVGCRLVLSSNGLFNVRRDFTLEPRSDEVKSNLFVIKASDPQYDLAILEARDQSQMFPCIERQEFRAPVAGERSVIVGFPYRVHRPSPLQFNDILAKQASIGNVTFLRHVRFPGSVITDADALPGNSGSIVVSLEGNVLGVIHAIYEPDNIPNPGPQGFEIVPYGGISLFVPGPTVQEFLSRF